MHRLSGLPPRSALTILHCLVLIAGITVPAAAGPRDGRRFDPGSTMTQRAPAAPAELDQVTSFLGLWDVRIVRPQAEGQPLAGRGVSEITFMNRGHALMESLYVADLDGHELAAIHFLGFNPGAKRWFLAGADSWSERAWIADGGFDDAALALSDARRLGGTMTLTQIRYRYEQPSENQLRFTIETSTDGGASFAKAEQRTYTRRQAGKVAMARDDPFGSPAPNRVEEAAGFDFLIGEWSGSHDLTLPTGQTIQWVSNDTAVHALNGRAVLEFSWFDTDPNLPDAATTILRLYNRNMRRWENLFLTNRAQAPLYFGGAQEGDRIVLHSFAADAGMPWNEWVFHDITVDTYRWYGQSSADRGESWTKTWTIELTRKPKPEPN